VLETCRQVSESDARLRWADDAFLLAHGVAPWTGLPLWNPSNANAFLETGDDRAIAAGLAYRPLAATTSDTLAWDRSRPPSPLSAGLTAAREASLLAAL
jgi:2'-hydroxyisoflavone reductase